MTTLSQLAQLELELINRARMDPLAEAQRAGLTDLNWLVSTTSSGFPITADPKQVLAGNNQLTTAAVGHTTQMIAMNNVAHDGIGDFDPGWLATEYPSVAIRLKIRLLGPAFSCCEAN